MSRDRGLQIRDMENQRCKSSIVQVEKESGAKTKPGKRFRGHESPVEDEEVRAHVNHRIRKSHRKGKSTILSWLIDDDDDTLQELTSVHSIDRSSGQVTREGIIKRDGIECTCCDEVFSIENFHVHGGRACDKPYESILIKETGINLLACMKKSWNSSSESKYHEFNNILILDAKDPYDDTCVVCADGGLLSWCSKCNSTYHYRCILDIKCLADKPWYCPYCVCKFCTEPALQDVGRCPQCEKHYHLACHELQEDRGFDLNRTQYTQFCQRSCKQVCDGLESMVGRRNELDGVYSWTLLRRMDDVDGKWIVCHSKLAVARRLMQECFDQIKDSYTKVDVIPSVVYNCGARFPRVDYKGCYTAILEKDGVIVSAASLRIHGTKLAEMPFIATSEEYRRKRMCTKLMAAIETALRSLNVEHLVIPAVKNMKKFWLNKYGFCHLDSSMVEELRFYRTVMFHNSVRLQRFLLPQDANAEQQPS